MGINNRKSIFIQKKTNTLIQKNELHFISSTKKYSTRVAYLRDFGAFVDFLF